MKGRVVTLYQTKQTQEQEKLPGLRPRKTLQTNKEGQFIKKLQSF